MSNVSAYERYLGLWALIEPSKSKAAKQRNSLTGLALVALALVANMQLGCAGLASAGTPSPASTKSHGRDSAPSITIQPISQAVIAGQTATFSATASGAAPLSYQWARNGRAISGATSSSYTTPVTATSQSGAQFSVTISNSAGNVTSNAATLTVDAIPGQLTASSSTLRFGDVATHRSRTLSVTFTNSGSVDISVSNVTISGAGFTSTAVSSGLIVNPGHTATLEVTFAPVDTGSVTGSVTVASNAPNSPSTVTLAGTGTSSALSPSGPIVIKGQDGTVIEGLKITSATGDCVQIINSSNITVQNSEIGPCAGNAVKISGGNGIRIFDSYIHPETLSPKCCDHNDGIIAMGPSNLLIQGNVIAYGESNIEVQGANIVTIVGNLLLNPRDELGGTGPRGANFQCWSQTPTSPGCTNVTVENNYALSSLDTISYLYPEATEDSISFGHTDGIVVQSNFITGGHSRFGCGLNADKGANSARFLNNRLLDTGQCGIAVNDGTNQLVDYNKILNRTPVAGSGNSAISVWNFYSTNGNCGPVTVSNNIAIAFKPDGRQSGFWKGLGCDPLTLTNNVLGQSSVNLLTPVDQVFLPPLIPPQPKNCVVTSPYSTQIGWPPCVP
jgi:hypothetical protein